MSLSSKPSDIHLPRIAITYCVQCRWLLRAAYYGQELLSTFSTSIGEVALIPSTGGVFTVYLTYLPRGAEQGEDKRAEQEERVLLWDRKAEEGFPETKILKQRVRNHIDPEKALGHSDTPSKKKDRAEEAKAEKADSTDQKPPLKKSAADCEDCK